MRVLALLVLLAASSASATRLRFRMHHAKAAAASASSSSSSSSSGACAALASGSDTTAEPVFSTQCPSVCGQQSACIVYPPQQTAACPSDSDRSCYNETDCSVECLESTGDTTSWLFTFYDNDEAMYSALLENLEQYTSVLVNASVVHRIAAFENVDDLISLYVPVIIAYSCIYGWMAHPHGIRTCRTITGNEPASDLLNQDDVFLPRDDIVALQFPETFLHSLETLQYMCVVSEAPLPPALSLIGLSSG